MKKLLLTALLVVSFHASASVEHDDGSITLSKDEKEAVESMINDLMQQRKFLILEFNGALEYIKRMQEQLEAPSKGKCV